MDPLTLLLDLQYWERRQNAQNAWRKLVRHDTFFRALQAAPKEVLERAGGWVYECRGEAADAVQWNIARGLVWCAKQAAIHPDFYRSEIDRVCFAIADTPEFVHSRPTWAWGCIRTFLEPSVRTLKVPVALWRESDDKGFCACVQLDLLEPGAGQVFHHPCDAFAGSFRNGFEPSLEDAWLAARRLAQEQSGGETLTPCDGRWRLHQHGEPITGVEGRSASGAAALGWYHLLRGTFPDEGVIVVAQVNSAGMLEEVEQVPAKVRAIAEDGSFDTVVVAGRTNQREAESALRGLDRLGAIRVANLDAGQA